LALEVLAQLTLTADLEGLPLTRPCTPQGVRAAVAALPRLFLSRELALEALEKTLSPALPPGVREASCGTTLGELAERGSQTTAPRLSEALGALALLVAGVVATATPRLPGQTSVLAVTGGTAGLAGVAALPPAKTRR